MRLLRSWPTITSSRSPALEPGFGRGKGVQDLQPPAIGIVIRVIGKRDTIGKVEVQSTARSTATHLQHRDRELADLG